MRGLRAALLLAVVLPVAADLPRAEPPPTAPAYLDPALASEVTIVRRGTDTVEEYRVGGKLYMLKVAPANGAQYFLIDEQGDGQMTRRTVP